MKPNHSAAREMVRLSRTAPNHLKEVDSILAVNQMAKPLAAETTPMKLPSDALIAPEKATSYLLEWRPADDKSALLARAGYTQDNASRLMADIRQQVMPLEANLIEQTEYGPKYMIRGALTGPNGNLLRVVTIWMTEATGETKFVTLYPDKT